jgi:hypothetical protein
MPSHDESERNDRGIPARGGKREAQDREKGRAGQAQSPVDRMHVDAPTRQDNERGHRKERELEEE